MARRSSKSFHTSAPGSSFKSTKKSDAARTSGYSKWVSSYDALGEIFGLHRASFPRLIKRLKFEGIPAPAPRANGDHDVEAWREFFKANPEVKRQAADGSLRGIREAIDEEKLRELKRENDVQDGLYLRRSEVEAWLTNKVQMLRDRLRAKLKNELPAKLAGLRAEEIAEKMEREIVALCSLLQGL